MPGSVSTVSEGDLIQVSSRQPRRLAETPSESELLLVEDSSSRTIMSGEVEGDLLVVETDPQTRVVQLPSAAGLLVLDREDLVEAVHVVRERDLLVVSEGSGQPGPPGPPGPAGPAGPPGEDGAGAYYEVFAFAEATTVWVINHGLNTFGLSVETVDLVGESIEGDVEFIDANTIHVEWYFPTGGSARVFR